ncbi:hypothetical protein HYC85_029801 [Camellia sinensis]|uniref:Uncharacterized protein n=1 Tax=Camellia sinensis TaxID=4442 RepID=A0A7J7FYX0_CAMSI|nr:hypothetical protein HYC85_029801 [Camellia sinensis]
MSRNIMQLYLSLDEYTRLFYNLVTRSEFPWNEDVMILIYYHGLNLQISCALITSRLYHIADAVQVAIHMEEEVQQKSHSQWTPIHGVIDALDLYRNDEEFQDGMIGIIRPLLATGKENKKLPEKM